MAPYSLGDTTVPAEVVPVSLAQNESLRPPSPRALEAATAAIRDAAIYPASDDITLREALAARHGVHPDGIVIGAGSIDVIAALVRAFVGAGDAVLAPEHAYPFFRTATVLAGARFDTAPEDDFTVSVDALLRAVTPQTRLVFVANPGNPTGTRVSFGALSGLRDGLPSQTMLIVDEAYGEFADHEGESAFPLMSTGNTAVLRTFSKAYGLAGLRIGWGVFPNDVATEIRKAINPSAVSAPAQAAAAAALEDQAYMEETVRLTAAARTKAYARLHAEGLPVINGFANFLLLPFKTEAEANAADASLRSGGIIVRRQGGAGLPHALRLTIGQPEAMKAAIAQLTLEKDQGQ